MHIEVPSGSIHLLSGPNGCGKSLLLDAAVGVGPAKGLSVRIGKRVLDGRSSYSRWIAGLRRMFQSPLIPRGVTTRQALQYAIPQASKIDRVVASAWLLAEAAEIRLDQPVGELSFGQRRVVDLCVALQSSHAVLLDEPFAAMSPQLVPHVAEAIRGTASDGVAILVVDHQYQASSLIYSRQHDWISPRDTHTSAGNDNAPLQMLARCIAKVRDEPVVQWYVHRIFIGEKGVIGPCSIRLESGKLIAISGGNGSGKTTVLRALAGIAQPWGGIRAYLEGPMAPLHFHLSPQPPKLLPDLRVVDNLRYMLLADDVKSRLRLDTAHALLGWMGLAKDELWSRWAADLSGGEAAIVALVGAVTSSQPVLLLDEPFEGLSQFALPRAQQLLAMALSMGKCAMITTHDNLMLDLLDPGSKISLEQSGPSTVEVTGCSYQALLSSGEIK